MAKPKLALIPAAQGDKLYSVLPSSGVGDFDFSRSGGATRINSQGLIETVADGVSRLNYPLIDGKVVGCPSHLLEPARTQLIRSSEDFTSVWSLGTRITITSNSAISPDGTLNADKLLETANNSTHWAETSFSAISGNSYTISMFAKAEERTEALIYGFGDNGVFDYSAAYYDLENGVVISGSGASIEYYGNGWYRCIRTLQSGGTGTGYFSVGISKNAIIQYIGDDTKGLYIWGAQLEAGSYPTSYIPTSGTIVTRSAETANNSGDASTFNDSEGVLMAEYSDFNNDSFRQLTLSNGSNSNAISIMNTTTENQVVCFVNNGGVTQASISTILNSTHEFNKIAIKYKANDFSLYINGFEIGTDTSGTVPTGLNTLNFDNGASSGDVYGSTKQLQYFDSALNDSDLETLTSWVSFSDMAEGQLYTIE